MKRFLFFAALGCALACTATSQQSPVNPEVAGSNNLKPDEQLKVVAKEITNLIISYNYKKVPLNDSISNIIYTRYLDALDQNRSYLLDSDVKDFERFRTRFDDDLKNGDLNAAFYMFNVYQKRYNERIKYSLSQLEKDYAFTGNDTFQYDREKQPWMTSTASMDELWGKRIKYDLLNLKLATPDIAKNKATLKKRYESLLSQSSKLNNQDVFQYFMDAFTGAVDPHTNYFNPANAANFNIDMSRSLEGIGASLLSENEYVTIKSVVPGGPADKSRRIAVDDRIVAVSQGKDGEFVDVVGWRIDNAIALIRGPKGTTVRLRLLPKGSNTPKVVEMVRDKIILQDQSAKKTIKTIESEGKSYKIGVIALPAFYIDFKAYQSGDPNYKSTTRDVKLILDTLKQQKVDGVILDLRQNGGGSLIEAIELTGLFIKTGPVVQVRDIKNQTEISNDEDPDIAWQGPLGVMVDRFSASASEIFSAAIQDYSRGIIIGTQTYGKGTVQQAIDLDRVISPSIKEMLASVINKNKKQSSAPGSVGSQSKFGQINLTTAKFYRINGSSTQHKGVTPDVQFPTLIPLDKYGEDTEPSALPFDVIKAAQYSATNNFTAVKPRLVELHKERMKQSKEYHFLEEDIADMKTQMDKTAITLNETELKKERDTEEQKQLERDNDRRVARGLKPLKKGETRPRNEDLDFLRDEAAQIVVDMIRLTPSGT
ncbi:MAG: carboxy terminal-processing peptidase [Mucilaginibacter polytrichastri]|nr:carboxy terminal-processing peptidase [Mucilaginibacter polytrichastri]